MRNRDDSELIPVPVPRRKYGRLVKPMPAVVKPEKCRFCRAGRACPVHSHREMSP